MSKQLNQKQKIRLARPIRAAKEEKRRISNKSYKTRSNSLLSNFYKTLAPSLYIISKGPNKKKLSVDESSIFKIADNYRRDIINTKSHLFSVKDTFSVKDINNIHCWKNLCSVEAYQRSICNKGVITKSQRDKKIIKLFKLFRIIKSGVELCTK